MFFEGLILLATGVSTSQGQPLAKADAGFVQCYEPDDSKRTCQSIASYQKTGDGRWDNVAVVLIPAAQAITLQTVTPVRVRGSAVCGFIRSEDIRKGTLRVSGRRLSDEQAAPILGKIAASLASLTAKEICTTYVAGETDWIAKAQVTGGAPVPDQRMRWIRPADGYQVASR